MTSQTSALQFLMHHDEIMGRWASHIELNIDPHGFTLDFFRVDWRRRNAILVSRVTISALTATALAERLDRGLARHAARLVEAGIESLAFGAEPGDNAPDETDNHPE